MTGETRSGAGVCVPAPAKVNLYLEVGAVRTDGYHDVITVLQTIELHDDVCVRESDSLRVQCIPDLGIPAEENLGARAASALASELGREPYVDIRIVKRIPHGAGLGGGSSDAAAVLLALSRIWAVDHANPVLREVAAGLGADVPFFLDGGTALYDGRGDRFVRELPSPQIDVVVVKPDAPVSTAEAYAAFDRSVRTAAPGARGIADACRSGDPAALGAALFNNMTDASMSLVPDIADALAWMRAARDVLGVSMCGSGSAVFGLFPDATSAAGAAEEAGRMGWWSRASRTTGPGSVAWAWEELQ